MVSILTVPWACAPPNYFFSRERFLEPRYLDEHVNPKMAQCSQWYSPLILSFKARR